MPIRVVFMGTPDFSVPTFAALVAAGHDVVAAYTRAPQPAGRGMGERKSEIHEAAEAHGIPVFTPKSLRNKAAQIEFAAHRADVAVVVAYGLILPEPILAAPRYGCLNLHGSLLPRWRGAAPIQRAIMAGDAKTGVMVMKMDAGLDTGPVALTATTAIGPDETAADLHDRLAEIGAALMAEALDKLQAGELTFTEQSATGATYARKIEKAESRINWSAPAEEVHNHIRGLSPFPGAWFDLMAAGKKERVKVLKSHVVDGAGRPGELLDDELTVACGSGAIRLLRLQRAGKQAMDAGAFLRGRPILKGTALP